MTKKLEQMVIPVASGSTAEADSTLISTNAGVHHGKIEIIKIAVDNFPSGPTFEVSLKDEYGNTKWSKSAIGNNGTTVIYPTQTIGSDTYIVPVPICQKEYWGVVASKNPGGKGNVTIDAEYTPDPFEKLT